jgi:hypothetical protein
MKTFPRQLLFIALISCLTNPALADLQGAPATPVFSQEEVALINSNETLLKASQSDPWLVRRLLDVVERTDRAGAGAKPSDDSERPSPPPSDVDQQPDPDTDEMERTSPEAAHDLFQLLKQAGPKKPNKPK